MTLQAASQPPSDGPDLGTLDDRCRTGFAGLIDCLGDIRMAGNDLVVLLGQIAELGERNKGLGEVRGFLTALDAAREAFGAAVSDSRTATIRNISNNLQRDMKSIRQGGTTLWAISARFRSTALGTEQAGFEEYALALRDVAQNLVNHSDRVLASIDDVVSREMTSISAGKAAFKSLADLKTTVTTPLNQTRELTEQAREMGVQTSRRAGLHRDKLQDGIVNLVSMIQFSDQMAQRLDHISIMLHRHEGCGHLAATQLQGLAHDLKHTITQATRRLNTLADDTRATYAETNAQGFGGAMAATIDCQRTTLSIMMEESGPVTIASQKAEENLEHMQKALEETAASFVALRTFSDSITQASHNAMVMAARSGGTFREALFVLSSAVKDAAKDCIDAIQLSEQSLEQLRGRSVGEFVEVQKKARDMTTILTKGLLDLSNIESANQELAQTMDQANDLHESMVRTVQDALGHLDAMADLPRHLRQVARDIDSGTPPAPEVADEIRKLYTMECERQLHDALFDQTTSPRTAAPATATATATASGAPSSPEAPDIDDVFF